MFRFIHAADGQMGMMLNGLGPAAPKVRAARLEALHNVLRAAVREQAQAILLAGDLFEDNQVGGEVVEQVAQLLNDQAAVPVYILPGNHDPYSRDSIYRRPVWGQLKSHIHVLTSPAAIALADDVVLLPCPLARKNGVEDPTAVIPPRGADTRLRIGLAHGTMRIRDDVGDDDFPIPLDVAELRGLDYLALGHWHSVLSDASRRAWYSGTYETTKFGERDSGNVLAVTLERPGQPPQVKIVPTGILTWQDHAVDLNVGNLEDAMRRLREWPNADHTLLRLALRGQAEASALALLPDLKNLVAQRFVHCVVDDSGLRPGNVQDELGRLAAAPYLRQAAEELQAAATGQAGAAVRPEVARRALEILCETAWEKMPKT